MGKAYGMKGGAIGNMLRRCWETIAFLMGTQRELGGNTCSPPAPKEVHWMHHVISLVEQNF
jgi:hypothetical protein